MNRLTMPVVRFALFSIVVLCVSFPGLIDHRYGYVVVLAVVLLIVLMVIDGISAARKLKRRKG